MLKLLLLDVALMHLAAERAYLGQTGLALKLTQEQVNCAQRIQERRGLGRVKHLETILQTGRFAPHLQDSRIKLQWARGCPGIPMHH